VYEARENGLPDYEGGIVTHEFLRELADHPKLTKSSTSKRPGIRSVDSRSSQSGTSFATAKSSTLTPVPRADRRVALFIPREGCGAIQSWVVLRGDCSMGHRALVAYERTDGQYTLHYSQWGAANLKLKHRISAESPFGGDDTDSKWAKQLLAELADGL